MLCEQILRSPVLGQSSLASVVAHLKIGQSPPPLASVLGQSPPPLASVVARWVMARWVVRAVVGALVVRGANAQNSVERPKSDRLWAAASAALVTPHCHVLPCPAALSFQ